MQRRHQAVEAALLARRARLARERFSEFLPGLAARPAGIYRKRHPLGCPRPRCGLCQRLEQGSGLSLRLRALDVAFRECLSERSS